MNPARSSIEAGCSTWNIRWRRWALAALASVSFQAFAGQSCEATPPDVQSVTQGLALAEDVQRSLDASGADVVLLARVGQDLSKYGLRFSHLGFAYRATIAVPSAPGGSEVGPVQMSTRSVWRIAHKLNQCGTATAAVYRQGLGEFFLDRPFRYEAAYIVPTPEVQAALLPVLRDDTRLLRMHTPAYSIVAYPWATTYQQSNQWALETLAGALEPRATTRPQAQAWLQLRDYRPTDLHIDALTRLGGRMTRANVAFDDHPNAQRYSDHILTVTVDSVFAWLQRDGLAGPPVLVH